MFMEFDIGILGLLAATALFAFGTIVPRVGVYLASRMRTVPPGHFFRYLIATAFKCDHCKYRFSVAAWLPFAAWFHTKDKCFLCGGRPDWIHAKTELTVGIVSVLVPVFGDWTIESLWMLFIFWLCIILSWVDLQRCVILQFGTLVLLFTGLLWSPFEPDPLARSAGAAVSALSMWLSFTFIGLFKDIDTDSGGDISLVAGAGAWIGLNCLPIYLLASSSIYLIHAIAVKKSTGNTWVPMAPALSAGLLTTQTILLLNQNF